MLEIFKLADEFPKKSPHAADPSKIAKGDGVDGKTPSEHRLAALFKDGKLATCPKNTPAAKRSGEPEVILEMTSKVIVRPAMQDVMALPGGWVNCAEAVKSFAVQPRSLPARVPMQDWSVSAVMLAVWATTEPAKNKKAPRKNEMRK